MSIIAKRRPSAPLDRHVESLWTLAPGTLAGGAVTLLPVGRASLAIALGDGEFHVFSDTGTLAHTVRSPMLCHAMAQAVSVGLPLSFRGRVMGANFKPGGLRAFTSQGLADIEPGVCALEAIWGEQVRGWGARLGHAADAGDDAALALLEELLVAQLRVSAEADALRPTRDGMALKAYRLAFRDVTGLNPKSFARLERFRSVLARLRRKDAGTLTEVAVDHDYTDQSHFVHDFKALSGMTPSAYVARGDGQGACLFTRLAGVWQRLVGRRAAVLTSANPDKRSDPRALSGR